MTYSPDGDTNGCPHNLMELLERCASKYFLVEEKADKLHVQCAFQTQKGYSRSWGNKVRKDLGYSAAELKIHPHNDILGAVGYQEGVVLACKGFTDAEIQHARDYYKNRVMGKYYRDHAKTMVGLLPSQVNLIKAHVGAKEGLDDEHAIETRMVEMGMSWPGMKVTDPYLKQCRIRDGMATGGASGGSC